MDVTYEFASGKLITFSIYEASSGGLFQSGEVELRGTQGTLNASEKGYNITPSGTGQFQTVKSPLKTEAFTSNDAMLADGSSGDSTAMLIKNFVDCVKTRNTPFCPIEEGHRSTSFAHLANIALATGEKLRWDPDERGVYKQ